MTTKHTPGPWRVEYLQWDHGASLAIVVSPEQVMKMGKEDSPIIAIIQPLNGDEEPNMHTARRGPHDEANANLLASAPNLLACLYIVAMQCPIPISEGMCEDDSCIGCVAKEAIAEVEKK